MKIFFTTIAFLMSISFFSQSFKATSKYSITNFNTQLNALNFNAEDQVTLHLYQDTKKIIKLSSLTKKNLDTFLSVHVEILENSGLDNVKNVIRVRFEFVAGCSDYETQYFIQTNDCDIIELPTTEFTFCEYEVAKVEYIFPSQQFGEENSILKTTSFLDENGKTESIFIIEKNIWEEEQTIEELSIAIK
ncbi:MAG: hypothetical protein V3U80_11230 [Flavobacteriaceae bacterium]